MKKLFLLFARNNNYTLVGGLMVDMAPGIGPVKVKTVIIDKNDNAEGIVEFAQGPVVGQSSNLIATKLLCIKLN